MVIQNFYRILGFFSFPFLISGFIFTAFGVTAPYVIEAHATGDRGISISWRNNDLSTERFIILRKTSNAPFHTLDSAAATTTVYVDSNVAPSTQYFYALLALAQGNLSDTSNIATATTATLIKKFIKPEIELFWNSVTHTASIAYYDSSTIETGYRFYRKEGSGNFLLLTTQIDSLPYLTGFKSFQDSGLSPNTWYTYKIEVFNNSDSLFSLDTEFLNYSEPAITHSDSITKTSEFPITPVGWSEKVGDSLFIVENDINSANAITVIDIKNRSNPIFKGYLQSSNLPPALNNTKIATYIKLHLNSNQSWLRQFFSVNNFNFVFKNDTLFQYNAMTQAVIRSIVFPNSQNQNEIIGQLNDSLILLYIFTNDPNNGNRQFLYTCKFSNNQFDTLNKMEFRGNFVAFKNQKAYFTRVEYSMCMGCQSTTYFHLFDYSQNPLSPSHFQIAEAYRNGYNQSTTFLVDPYVTIYFWQPDIVTLELQMVDIRSALAKPLSSFTEPNFKGGEIKNVIIDSTTHDIFIIGAKSFAIYNYSHTPAAIKMNPGNVLNVRSSPLTTRITPRGIFINFGNNQDHIERLSIFNTAGKLVRQFPASNCNASPELFWDAKDSHGATLSPGSYFLVLKNAQSVRSGRVLLVQR